MRLYSRDVLIKQLEQDYVAAVLKHKTQKEEYTRKLLVFRQEVNRCEISVFIRGEQWRHLRYKAILVENICLVISFI